MDLRQFITAGAEESGRRPFQKLDVKFRVDLSGKIYIFLIQKALDSVEHAIDFVKPTFFRIFYKRRPEKN